MNLENISQTILVWLVAFGLKVLGAIALWVIGRWLIYFAVGLVTKTLRKRPIEPTIVKYLGSTISVLLNVTLVVAILGYFGVQTTTFAALIASAGLAIGLAWSGLLSNFASGAFLVILRPFKVGDFISAGGVTGTVEDIGLDPPPDIEVLRFSPYGPVLAVRPYCNNQHYWQVYFDTNRTIRETFREAGFPVPEQHLAVATAAFAERQDGHSSAATN